MAEGQDLHLARPQFSDRNWPVSGVTAPVADPVRLGKPHQTVCLFNSGPSVQIVFDRYYSAVEIKPGERKLGVEMLLEDIAYFREQRREPRRLIPRYDGKGKVVMIPAPLHPLMIEDVPAARPVAEPDAAPEEDVAQLARMNALAAASERRE